MTFPLLPVAPVLLAVGLIAGCSGLGGSGATTAGGRGRPPRPRHRQTRPVPRPPRPVLRNRPGRLEWLGHQPSPAVRAGLHRPARSCSSPPPAAARPTVSALGRWCGCCDPGPAAPPGGSEPPRLAGDALAAAPAHLPRTPSVTYTAVRPGTAVLTIVGLPRPIQPVQGAAASAWRGALAPAVSAAAAETAYRAWSTPVAGAARPAPADGMPAGAECEIQQALRVSIVVR